MTTTIDSLRSDLRIRLGDTSGSPVWADATLNVFLHNALEGLYPAFHQPAVALVTAVTGPVQTLPAGVVDVYAVGVLRAGGARVQPVLNWTEGVSQLVVPKTDIAGLSLVVSYTKGWPKPSTTATSFDMPFEVREPLLLRAQIAAFEELLSKRILTKGDTFLANQARQQISEEDVMSVLGELRGSLREYEQRAKPLPEVVR